MADPAVGRLFAAALGAGAFAINDGDLDGFDLEDWAARSFADDPFKKLVGLIGVGAVLFYRAEVGHNPKVNSYWDALVYTSTCASVGYGDIFAQTPVGKAVGSLIMTVGPAMANSAFIGHARVRQEERAIAERTQREILTILQDILGELKATRRGR